MPASISLQNIQKTYDLPILSSGAIKGIRDILFSSDKTLPTPTKVHRALDQISLSIAEGERVGFIGENGAGKSTLLGIMAGTIVPTQGTCTINGQVNAVLTLGVGLRDELTGRENLILSCEMNGMNKNQMEEKIEKMISFCELGKFIDLPMRCYSSGMKAKIAFASVVFVDPEILMLDETLSVGDRWFAQKAYKKMKELCDAGKIVLLVSHSLDTIKEFCTRCIWLDKGQIKMDGDPQVVIKGYEDFLKEKEQRRPRMEDDLSPPSTKRFIHNFRLFNITQQTIATELMDEDDAELHVDLKDLKETTPTKLQVIIERLDGVIIGSSALELNTNNPRLKVHLGKLLVRPGYYKATLRLVDGEVLLEDSTFRFQIFSDKKTTGGDPMLRWPAQVSVQKNLQI